jgi:hypothetical protein
MPLEQTEGQKIANRRTILGGLLQVGCGALPIIFLEL